jgi:ankyrin repeat protein
VKWSDKELECIQALRTSASDYEQFKDRNSSRLRGTCKWVLHHDNFQNWKNSSSSSLLWISADPGCGKSVLSKSLVDEDIQNTDTRTICYFFFKDDNDAQKDVAIALSALLHQLFQRKPKLIKHAMSDFAANGNKFPQLFHTLWDILINTVADPEAGEVVCILDALDECVEAGRYQIINALRTFYQQASSGKNTSQLKICVTSRPYPDIERRFTDLTDKFPTIRLHGEQESDVISHEIDLVIKWRVSQLGSELKLNNSERSNLEIELLGMTHRTYLWLTLIFDIIRKMIRPTSRKLKAVVSNLPSTVYEAYEAILTRVEEDDRLQARKLLYIIIGTTRPLTLNEMNIALAIEDHHRSYDDLKPDLDDEARFEVSVRHLCGLFVTVVDKKVYLIHQTAKEFLLSKSEAATHGWKHSLTLKESETLMARICITYLSFTEFDRATDQLSAAIKYSYLDYVAGSWAAHYREAQYSATEQMLQLVLRVCDTQSQRFKTWFNIYWTMAHREEPNPCFASPLMVGSYFGHEVMVKLLLEAKANVELKDCYEQTPLSWAAQNGHEGIVKLLLEAKANVESNSSTRRTPLSRAAQNGHEGIVKLLLEAKADVESKGRSGRTPLSLAAENGYEGIVKLLLEAKADVESKGRSGWTSLSLAAMNGHEGIVRLLLEAKADVESKDYYGGQTPLSWAAMKGHEGIVKLLLEAKADVESKGRYVEQTPLSLAAENGYEGTVKLLLEAKADVESNDRYGRTPLSLAAGNGYEGIVRLLLEAKADVESNDRYGRTPLSLAAGNGHEGIVRRLDSFSATSFTASSPPIT